MPFLHANPLPSHATTTPLLPRTRLELRLCSLASSQLLVNEETAQTDGNNEDNAEHNNNTSFPAGPVAALGDVRVGLSGHEGLDGRHFSFFGSSNRAISQVFHMKSPKMTIIKNNNTTEPIETPKGIIA